MSHDNLYMTKKISDQLIDATILDPVISEDREAFGFRARRKNGAIVIVWVDCDAEGNGPGWLTIEPIEMTQVVGKETIAIN